MNFNQSTLQDWFYEQEKYLKLFPDGKNYVSVYKTFKDFLDKDVHPEIKPVMSREGVYLNDHSEKHVAMVIEKATYLLSGMSESDMLSPYEVFILLTAIQIHDAGHIINANRDTHAIDASKIINELDKSVSVLERKTIVDVARAHSGKQDLIGSQKTCVDLSEKTIRFRLLAAILRFADELADGKSRASNYLLKEDLLPEESKIYHAFSSCLDSFKIDISCHEVNLTFCLNEDDVANVFKKHKIDKNTGEKNVEETFLIDEIYARTLKTFNESLYYNRFVPQEMWVTVINVEILFLRKVTNEVIDFEHINFLDPIKYKVEEMGYPRLFSEDIFTVCKDSLISKDGNKLDGQYINQLIKKEHVNS